MYIWFSLLSTRQRSEIVAMVLIMAIILGVGVVPIVVGGLLATPLVYSLCHL